MVDDNSEHKKANGINKNVVATIRQNVYKDVFLNKKCLRHSMNRIQIKDHGIGTYEIYKIKKKKTKKKRFLCIVLMIKYTSKTMNASSGLALGY